MTSYQEKTSAYPTNTLLHHLMRIALPVGIAGGIVLILYFLIIKAMGLHTETTLRWVNFILIIPVVVFAINRYVHTATNKSYLEAFLVSIVTGLGAYFILSVFMVIYLFVDPVFMSYLRNAALPELDLNELSIFLMIMFEGVVGSVILSFVILQFFKDDVRKAA